MSKRILAGVSPTGGTIELQATQEGLLRVLNEASPSSGMSVLGVRQDADGSPVANGENHPFIFNQDGRLKTAGAPAQYTPITGTITANGQTISMDTTSVSNVVCHTTGTFSAVTVVFEASLDSTDGINGNWFGIQAVRTNANTVETTTGSLSATPAYGWELSVNAFKWIRVRASAFTSGTQTWVFTLGAYATEPIPAIQTHAVTQSGAFTFTPLTPTSYVLASSAATTNAVSVKTTAGSLFLIVANNSTTSTTRYLKLYNKASAPTVGTDVPVITIPLPAGKTIEPLGTLGRRFSTGIAFAITANQIDTDTTAIAAGDIKMTLDYV